jgi:hypothetical protein
MNIYSSETHDVKKPSRNARTSEAGGFEFANLLLIFSFLLVIASTAYIYYFVDLQPMFGNYLYFLSYILVSFLLYPTKFQIILRLNQQHLIRLSHPLICLRNRHLNQALDQRKLEPKQMWRRRAVIVKLPLPALLTFNSNLN